MPPKPSDLIARVEADVERNVLRAKNGIRNVRGTDRPKLAATPKDVIWRRDRAQLWRYKRTRPRQLRAAGPDRHSLVSRSYISTCAPARAPSSSCATRGSTYPCSTGGSPTSATPTTRRDVRRRVPAARGRAAAARDRARRVTSSATASAASSRSSTPPARTRRVRNLVLLATPDGLHRMGPMVAAVSTAASSRATSSTRRATSRPTSLYSGFFMMAPTNEVAQYATLLENLWNDEFVKGYQAMASGRASRFPSPAQRSDSRRRLRPRATPDEGRGTMRRAHDRLHKHGRECPQRDGKLDLVVPREAAQPSTARR